MLARIHVNSPSSRPHPINPTDSDDQPKPTPEDLSAAVSRLPVELLAEVFLDVAESSLEDGNTRFAAGTFSFLQVCKHWNEVAVNTPRLWRWWVADAAEAWPLFNSRSEGISLLLTWRSEVPESARDILMDPTVSKRIQQLDFTGTSKQLARALDVFDSAPPSNTSSIRLHVFPYNYNKVSQLPGCFLSSPFPKLSKLDLAGFLPDPSSPIFTTSNLTSLKLFVFCRRGDGYTLSQLSQILQSHPNLREIGLDRGAIPLPVPSQPPPVPFVLPQLVDLRLYGPELPVLGFIDLIGMSSPLHNVVVRFGRTRDPLASAAKKVLVAYYGCPGLEQPRKVDRLTISHDPMNNHLTFNTQSDSAPTSNLELKFNEIDEDIRDTMVEEAFPLFPLNDIQEFAASGLDLHGDFYRGMFQGMKSLSHLRLCNLSISPVLDGLSSISQGALKSATGAMLIRSHAYR